MAAMALRISPPRPTEAALDSLTSRLRAGPSAEKAADVLPPLGTRTVGSGASPPPAERPAPPSSSKSTSTPLPPLQPLPRPEPLSSSEALSITFDVPKKRIISSRHLSKWQESKSFDEILGFIMYCNESVIGKKLNDNTIKGQDSPAIKSILSVLQRISALVKETPAETETTSRFGNQAFRTFYRKIVEESVSLHESIPGMKESGAIVEVEKYFVECFGNEKRIDYGSGMELNFVCWLLCLVRLNILDLEKEAPAIVLCVFWSYINVMREIQSTYWLEPAGSHGVWGLDDYHFLPFLFGSSQLKNHKYLKPKAIHDQEILDEFSKEYMYLACIRFINSIKTASLRWHSPMLDDISGVRSWAKVNEGMMKMYKAEVLLKLPIAQHMFFGSLITFPQLEEGEIQDVAEEDAHGHIHDQGGAREVGWGDCCGIPIPSAFAAAQEEREKQASGAVRRIPFD